MAARKAPEKQTKAELLKRIGSKLTKDDLVSLVKSVEDGSYPPQATTPVSPVVTNTTATNVPPKTYTYNTATGASQQ